MGEESGGETMKDNSRRRGEIMEEKSWRKIMEEQSWRILVSSILVCKHFCSHVRTCDAWKSNGRKGCNCPAIEAQCIEGGRGSSANQGAEETRR